METARAEQRIELTDQMIIRVTRLEELLASRLAQVEGRDIEEWLRCIVAGGVEGTLDRALRNELQRRLRTRR